MATKTISLATVGGGYRAGDGGWVLQDAASRLHEKDIKVTKQTLPDHLISMFKRLCGVDPTVDSADLRRLFGGGVASFRDALKYEVSQYFSSTSTTLFSMNAEKGPQWKVAFKYRDRSGRGVASGTYYVHAPDKEAAQRYAKADLGKKYQEFRVYRIIPVKVKEAA